MAITKKISFENRIFRIHQKFFFSKNHTLIRRTWFTRFTTVHNRGKSKFKKFVRNWNFVPPLVHNQLNTPIKYFITFFVNFFSYTVSRAPGIKMPMENPQLDAFPFKSICKTSSNLIKKLTHKCHVFLLLFPTFGEPFSNAHLLPRLTARLRGNTKIKFNYE